MGNKPSGGGKGQTASHRKVPNNTPVAMSETSVLRRSGPTRTSLEVTTGGHSGNITIDSLKKQLKAAEEKLKEKENVIRSLQRQLNQSQNEKDTQVSTVKHTVDMVIQEKDAEIRRLKALVGGTPEMNLVKASVDVVATKPALSDPALEGAVGNRFGISAEALEEMAAATPIKTDAVRKSSSEAAKIRKGLNSNAFLRGLHQSQVNQLIECMVKERMANGADIITQGEFGDRFYIVEKGQVEVYLKKDNGVHHVTYLGEGAVFGELAILYNCCRTASVRATTPVELWSLDRMTFQTLVKQSGQQTREEYVRLLTTVDKFKSLPSTKLMRIADCLDVAIYSSGEYIIRQGEAGDTFYVIRDGKVKVTQNKKKNISNKSAPVEDFICYMEKGDYFGELALLTEDNRKANVIAESDKVTLLMLDRSAFNSFIGHLSFDQSRSSQTSLRASQTKLTPSKTKVLQIHDYEEDEIGYSDQLVATKISKEHDKIIQNTSLEDLEVLGVLGQGGFGCVKLVRIQGLDKHAFALKAIRKAKIVQTAQQQHVLQERNIMISLKSAFIGKLHRTYRDSTRIYMLLDAYLGGELYNTLKKVGPLKDGPARFVSACTIEALGYLHERDVVYRDLKPENLMLDHRGYVKLVDFGFAKVIKPGFKTWTFCGTPEYFPPEILANAGHDISADYWSYGILIYELMTRTTPFFAANDMAVYEGILSGIEGVKFSKKVSKPAENLIRSLCKLEPRDRVGYQKDGVMDIRKHRWFQGFDWNGLRTCRITSPFDPDIKNPLDMRHFAFCEEDAHNADEDRKYLAKQKMDWEEAF